MLARASAGHTTATAWAERLMAEEGLSYREAHHRVGRFLADADEDRRSYLTPVVSDERLSERVGLDPVAVAQAARFGGGPGAPPALDDLGRRRAAIAADLAGRSRRWRQAETDLAAAVADVVRSGGGRPAPSPVLADTGSARARAGSPAT
jgi:hypothetical protein